jgi:hypothetical protein
MRQAIFNPLLAWRQQMPARHGGGSRSATTGNGGWKIPPSLPRLGALGALLLGTAALPAHAENFTATATISCAASLKADGKLDATFRTYAPPGTPNTNPPTQVACAGLRVSVMDADPAWDEYCGAAYTNSRGQVSIPASCADTIGGPPDVYLKVEARSHYGFSVGTHDYTFWDGLVDFFTILGSPGSIFTALTVLPLEAVDYLTKHATYAWITPEQPGNAAQINFGDLATGMGFDTEESYSHFASMQFWAAQYAMAGIRSTTSLWPMDFNYTVDAPLGSPTTVWDTVIVDGDSPFDVGQAPGQAPLTLGQQALHATPHEIGHVLYNTYHSSFSHWLYDDATDYMTTHDHCEDGHFMTLAWYEGFAHWVRHLAYSDYDWQSNVLHLPSKTDVCQGQPGFHLERNVTAVLDALYYGPWSGRRAQGDSMFACPAGFTRYIDSAGVVRCRQYRAPTCPAGRTLQRDRMSGITDACVLPGIEPVSAELYNRLLRACRNQPENCPRDMEAVVYSTCPAGSQAQRQPGADTCLTTRQSTSAYPGATPLPRGDGTPDRILARTPAGGLRWQQLMNADTLIGMVRTAGTQSHRMREMWDGWMRPWCLSNDTLGIPRYCNAAESPEFVQIVSPASSNFP